MREMMSLDMVMKHADFEMDYSKSSSIKADEISSIKMSNQEGIDKDLIPEYDVKDVSIPDERREPLKTSSKSNLPIIIGAIAVGCALILFLFMTRGKKKNDKGASGPTIVEVTELEGTKTKASVNNRQSSPRIIFGDLRKNPSLIVAPMVTPHK